MEGASVLVLLGVSTLLLSAPSVPAVFVNIVPNRLQFFSSESFSLSCAGALDWTQWTLKRENLWEEIQQCRTGQEDFGRFDGVSCTVFALTWLRDSGEYWCEDDKGRKSEKLSISVNDHLILEIPAFPVNVGDSVTLRCKSRSDDTGGIKMRKFAGVSWSSTELPSEVTFRPVKLSDGGQYGCSGFYQDMGLMSGQSQLTVKVPTTPPPTTPSPTTPTLTTLPPTTSPPPTPPPTSSPSPPPSVPRLRLLLHLVVVCPYCISTVLMASILRSLKKGGRAAVAMEMTGDNEGPDYEEIITEHNFGASRG